MRQVMCSHVQACDHRSTSLGRNAKDCCVVANSAPTAAPFVAASRFDDSKCGIVVGGHDATGSRPARKPNEAGSPTPLNHVGDVELCQRVAYQIFPLLDGGKQRDRLVANLDEPEVAYAMQRSRRRDPI